MAGYGVVIIVLGAGVVIAVQRLDALATTSVAAVRVEEEEITAAERLRWTGELIASAGRGYLLSGDRDLLSRVQDGQERFRTTLEKLKGMPVTPKGALLIADVERTAADFARHQEALLAKRARGDDPAGMVLGFETALRPAQRAMTVSFDRLVAHKTEQVLEVYATAARERARLMSWIAVLLGSLVVLVLAIAWYFTRRLTGAYRSEQEAVDRATRALAIRDDLMAIVAHDLRNPLGAITLKAAMIRRAAETERVREHAASIESVSHRMAFLIKCLLDVSSMEAGRFTVQRSHCSVDEVIRDTLELFAAAAAAKPISLDSTMKQRGLAIEADRERLVQVLSNLVGNAVKFTPVGGRVTIAVDATEVCVRFAVTDTGPGIEEGHIDHLFDRFWKHDKGGSRGTGLGLFIAKGIVEAHRGRIWAESVPGHGATFFFEVPRTPERPRRAGDSNANENYNENAVAPAIPQPAPGAQRRSLLTSARRISPSLAFSFAAFCGPTRSRIL